VSVRNLERLFKPASVALIGDTSKPGSVASIVARNLGRARFSGDAMVVDRHKGDGSLSVFPDIESLPHAPDLALIATAPDTVPSLIGELGARGTRAAIVLGMSFAALGRQGRELQQAMLDAAKPCLLRIVGPDSVGVVVPPLGIDASFSHLAAAVGNIAFVSQSNAIVTAMLDWAVSHGIGFSHVISLGEMADVDFGDLLDYLATDAGTRAILLYVETIENGRKFMSAARAAARTKPVLILKAGRSSGREDAANIDSGPLRNTDLVHDAAFRRAGVLRVATMAELFEAAETLASTREQIGDRLAILTNSGGAGLLAADALSAAGGHLADMSDNTIAALRPVLPPSWCCQNPIDLGAAASGKKYSDTLALLIGDGEIDAIAILNSPTALVAPDECAQAVMDTVKAAAPTALAGKNIFAAWLGEESAQIGRQLFAESRIANYETPDSAVAAFMHRVRYRQNRALLMETPPARADPFVSDIAAARHAIAAAIATGSWLDPDAAAVVLGAYGIPLTVGRHATNPDQAAAIARELGFPVVLKIWSPDIVAKSDIGGIALNLGDPDQVRHEAAAMLERVAAARPTARLNGFLVQPMIRRPGAIELLAGLVEDPVFGPFIVFGQGGFSGEIAGDRSFELPPLNALLARRLIDRTRASQLLTGRRGNPPADVDALVALLIRLGQLAVDLPEIKELELDPVLADAAGVIVLDARLRATPSTVAPAVRLAIAPYPQELISVETLRDGTVIDLRPLRPEDEPLLLELAAHMSPEDLRLRFFTPMRGLTHAVAARLSQLDYDRELALIALQGQMPLGVVRYFADPDRQSAEYAVTVRSDRKGSGLGYLLMNRLIAVARQRGIGELVGDVLRENEPMLRMCRELGFTIATQPADPSVMVVRKRLGEG
jgi:acetyltransferase